MSQMNEFYKKVSENQALLNKFEGIMSAAEQDTPEKTEEKLIEFAKSEGYQISLEEMKTFFESLSKQCSEEMTDSELDLVAGGKSRNGCTAVFSSVATVGIACAAMSALYVTVKANCFDQFK